MDLILDINSWLYPMDLGEFFFMFSKLITFACWCDRKTKIVMYSVILVILSLCFVRRARKVIISEEAASVFRQFLIFP